MTGPSTKGRTPDPRQVQHAQYFCSDVGLSTLSGPWWTSIVLDMHPIEENSRLHSFYGLGALAIAPLESGLDGRLLLPGAGDSGCWPS